MLIGALYIVRVDVDCSAVSVPFREGVSECTALRPLRNCDKMPWDVIDDIASMANSAGAVARFCT
jgi:hypothetical protein